MLWKLFTCFAKIGAFTIGGGYAMIPIIEREVVEKRGWVTREEFPDIIAIAQSAPGLLAVNVSIFVGHRVRGVAGSLIATLGCILPPFLMILLIAAVFTDFKDNAIVERIFRGVRPVVVAVILVPMINLAKRNRLTPGTAAAAASTLLAVSFLHISPVWILGGTILAAIAYTARTLNRKGGRL